MNRLATQHPVVVVPVVVDPVPVLDPAAVVPVDVIDVLGVVGVTPKCAICHPYHRKQNTQTGCILFGDTISPAYHTKYIHLEQSNSTVCKAIASHNLTYRSVQISIVQSRNRGPKHLLSKKSIS